MRARHPKQSGFTLLEVMVATAIMGIAVTALLANLHLSIRNNERVREAEKIHFAAQQEMDRLLTEPSLPNFQQLAGDSGNGVSWIAEATPFEYPLHPVAGTLFLQRVQLKLRWMTNGKEHTYAIEGYRQNTLNQSDARRIDLTAESTR